MRFRPAILAVHRDLGYFFAALTWVLIDYDVLSVENTTVLTYVILTMLSAIMATGMSWSHIRRRMSGQLDVDDVDDN